MSGIHADATLREMKEDPIGDDFQNVNDMDEDEDDPLLSPSSKHTNEKRNKDYDMI